MEQSVDVKRLPRYCVVCGGEYGPGLETHCTDKSLVAIKRVGFLKKETLYFTLDGEALSEDALSRMRETEAARMATWEQEQKEEPKRQAKPVSPERPTLTQAAQLDSEQEVADEASAQPSRLFKITAFILEFMAVVGVLGGPLRLFYFPRSELTDIHLTDAVYGFVSGIASFVCWRLLKRGNRLTILLFVGVVVAAIVYSFAVGRGFNYIFTIIGAAILAALMALWRRGEIG